ncbi:unnamed protein product, partial [Rotaria sp. Silwood1]
MENSYSHEVKVHKQDLKLASNQDSDVKGYWNYVELLPSDRFLRVSARCRRYDDGSKDYNGRIFDKAGNSLSQILLGDGIKKVQTDKDGFIWTSYFDEGIFGNFGWDDDPIGRFGL